MRKSTDIAISLPLLGLLTEVECRLFCSPIPSDRWRFRNFFKSLSYRHTGILSLCFDPTQFLQSNPHNTVWVRYGKGRTFYFSFSLKFMSNSEAYLLISSSISSMSSPKSFRASSTGFAVVISTPAILRSEMGSCDEPELKNFK